MEQIRVGIIGLGRSGKGIHATYFNSVPERFKIIAVSDGVKERRDKAEKEYCCAAYESYKQMIERDDMDLIVNASPSHLHVPISLELLNKGFNVICEKPLARSVKEGDELIAAAKQSGRLFTIFHDLRYAPHFQKVKKVIDSGVLGRIIQISMNMNSFKRRWDWQTLREFNGGNLLNNGSHMIDRALQLIGIDIEPKITCKFDRANSFGDAEDYVKLILQAPGRPLVDIEVSSCSAYTPCNYNIQGTCGGLTGTFSSLQWKYFKPSEAPRQKLTRTPLVDENGNPVYCSETLKWYEETWEDSRDEDEVSPPAYYSALYEAMTSGRIPDVTAEQVRMQMHIMEECFRQNGL